MLQQVCTEEGDIAAEDGLHPALYVVRSPEICWLSDDEPAVVGSDVGSIAGGFAQIDAALARYAFDEAQDISQQMWSLSRAAGAVELGDNIQKLLDALESRDGLSGTRMSDIYGLLEQARSSLVAKA